MPQIELLTLEELSTLDSIAESHDFGQSADNQKIIFTDAESQSQCLQLPQDSPAESRATLADTLRADGWDDEMAGLIAWAWQAELPTKPFLLLSGYNIFDPKLWYRLLLEDINDGPSGVRARTGILRRDLTALKAVVNGAGPEAETKSEWSEETAALINWFLNAILPTRPNFSPVKGYVISNPPAFYESLRRDISAGPKGSKVTEETLKHELLLLHRYCEIEGKND